MMKMKGKEAKAGPSPDLLVCFPSRAHLSLMPKPIICSPGRASSECKRRHHNHRLKKSSTRGGSVSAAMASSEINAEPTSPKVTCAGQIKVSQNPTTACANWQSVMQEIEKIHNRKNSKRSHHWPEAFRFKREITQFLTCLRSLRFDLRCFGAFPETDDVPTEEEEDEEDDDVGVEESDKDTFSGDVYSKWFMMLQENQNNGFHKQDTNVVGGDGDGDDDEDEPQIVPPSNALLLMRCRSAPAKSLLKENEDGDDEKVEKQSSVQSLKSLMEEEKRTKENMVVMTYDSDFYKLSTDIAKETWIVGGIRDPLSKSRSWKR